MEVYTMEQWNLDKEFKLKSGKKYLTRYSRKCGTAYLLRIIRKGLCRLANRTMQMRKLTRTCMLHSYELTTAGNMSVIVCEEGRRTVKVTAIVCDESLSCNP